MGAKIDLPLKSNLNSHKGVYFLKATIFSTSVGESYF